MHVGRLGLGWSVLGTPKRNAQYQTAKTQHRFSVPLQSEVAADSPNDVICRARFHELEAVAKRASVPHRCEHFYRPKRKCEFESHHSTQRNFLSQDRRHS